MFPLYLKFRGEIYIGKKDFDNIKGNFANPRNAAGGSLKTKRSKRDIKNSSKIFCLWIWC